jgi:guanylate kinase
VIGSKALFVKLWAAHDEIKQRGACGHAVCIQCGEFAVQRDRLDGRNDDEAKRALTILAEREQAHAEEHQGERRYANDAWFQGEW